MKSLFTLLLLVSPCPAQWVSCDYYAPVQWCPPQGCGPQYGQPYPQHIQEPDDPGTTMPPHFEPRPESVPVKPVPAPGSEDEKKILELMQNNTNVLIAIKASIEGQKPCECKPVDLTEINSKLDALALAIKTQPQIEIEPTPAQPPVEQHVVIVADRNANYWQRLAEAIDRTKQSYHGIQTAPLPSFPIGEHPQAIIYEAKVPVRVVKGQREVEALLYRLSRAEPI